jgi:hypothetical protein
MHKNINCMFYLDFFNENDPDSLQPVSYWRQHKVISGLQSHTGCRKTKVFISDAVEMQKALSFPTP